MVFVRITTELSSFTGAVFEEIGRNIVCDNLPFPPVKVGAWSDRSGDEFYIAVIREKPYRVLLGEVKWNSRPLGVN